MSQSPPPGQANQLNAILSRMDHGLRQLAVDQLEHGRRIARLEAIEYRRERAIAPPLPVRFQSQFGEDLFLWRLFHDQPAGYFIEVGAYDGVTLSVSYAFESVGWNGLLVEALPEHFAKCTTNRPGSRVVHAALGKRGAAPTTQFHVVEGDDGPLLSYHTTQGDHLEMIRRQKRATRDVTVPLTTLDALLEGRTGAIDFAVIDVEGGELDLLDGFDLARWRPRALIIEDNSRGKDPRLPTYMKAHPYRDLGWIGVNRAYVRSDETALIHRLKPPPGVG